MHDDATEAKQENTAEEANYFTEEGIEEGTEALMRKLEAAKDPEAYRERFHRRRAVSSHAARPARTTDATINIRSLLLTALAILIGAAAGILLSMYVI